MPPTFPCPNPACTHTFSPDAIHGAARLVCPRCGTVFQFGSAAPAAHKPELPSRKPSTADPKPPPLPASRKAVPSAKPAAAPSAPAAGFTPASPLVVQRRDEPIGRPSPVRFWLFGAAGVAVVALVVWGGLWLKHFLKQDSPVAGSAEVLPYNCQFTWPDKPWQRQSGIVHSLNADIGMSSPQHNESFVILFRDYKNRQPSDAEMLDEATRRLRSYFRGLEWEHKSGDPPARWMGHPSRVIAFQGDGRDSVPVRGECHMMTDRGYGYWFFSWAPFGELRTHEQAIRDGWTQLRKRLSLRDERKGWTAKPPESQAVSGQNAKYAVRFIKGLWTHEATEDAGAELDLLLVGHVPNPDLKRRADKDATLQVFVLPKQADLKTAVAAAREYLTEREKKQYERTIMEPIKDHDGDVDRDADIGKEPGHLIKWHVKSTADLERFLVAAVVNRPDGVVVLVGDCLWERRDFWDQELMELLETFKAR